MTLNLETIALIAAAVVAVIGLALALATPAGREAVGKLGLRVADALVGVLERLLSQQQQQQRATDVARASYRKIGREMWPPDER